METVLLPPSKTAYSKGGVSQVQICAISPQPKRPDWMEWAEMETMQEAGRVELDADLNRETALRVATMLGGPTAESSVEHELELGRELGPGGRAATGSSWRLEGGSGANVMLICPNWAADNHGAPNRQLWPI